MAKDGERAIDCRNDEQIVDVRPAADGTPVNPARTAPAAYETRVIAGYLLHRHRQP